MAEPTVDETPTPEVAAPVAPAPPSAFDVAPIHKALDEAERVYHSIFTELGHVPNEVERFVAGIARARMVADQSADMAPKNAAADQKQKLLADQAGVVYPQNPAPAPSA